MTISTTTTTTTAMLIDAGPIYDLVVGRPVTANTLLLSDGTVADLGEWLLILVQLAGHDPALAKRLMATAEQLLALKEHTLTIEGGDLG